MSNKARVDDAEQLWANGRKEGAWVQALIAVAATARLRYPKPIPDGQAFRSFICDIAGAIVSGRMESPGPLYIRFYSEDRSQYRTLEDIFYTELRCKLVHEVELKEVGFSESRLEGDRLVSTFSVPTRVQHRYRTSGSCISSPLSRSRPKPQVNGSKGSRRAV